jgi:hypothetical protein
MKTDPEKIKEVSMKVESNDFTIDVTTANPLRGKQIHLSYGYDLRIKNDSAIAFLPYFGVARSAPYGGGEGGIKFAEPMREYTSLPNKKGNGWDIKFKVNTHPYNYEVSVNVFNNGSSTIYVSSYERDPITFNGTVK